VQSQNKNVVDLTTEEHHSGLSMNISAKLILDEQHPPNPSPVSSNTSEIFIQVELKKTSMTLNSPTAFGEMSDPSSTFDPRKLPTRSIFDLMKPFGETFDLTTPFETFDSTTPFAEPFDSTTSFEETLDPWKTADDHPRFGNNRPFTFGEFKYTIKIVNKKIDTLYQLCRIVSDQQQESLKCLKKLAAFDELSDEFWKVFFL
jgi:hypothetical protein